MDAFFEHYIWIRDLVFLDNGWKSVNTRFYCMETRTECLHLLLFPIHGISVAVQTLFMSLVWCFMKCTLWIQSSINYCLKLWDFFPLLLCLLIKPYWYSYVLLQLVIMSCMEERGKHYSSICQNLVVREHFSVIKWLGCQSDSYFAWF